MKKADVETHSTHQYGPQLPAVNVKANGPYLMPAVVERFGCSEAVAERALDWQFQLAQHGFWEEVQDWAKEIWGPHVQVWSAGRCGGWAVVEGLGDIEDWDAIALGKWAKFAKWCRSETDYVTSEERVIEDIEANRWAEPDSEEYNFQDTSEGTICLADVPRCKHCGG